MNETNTTATLDVVVNRTGSYFGTVTVFYETYSSGSDVLFYPIVNPLGSTTIDLNSSFLEEVSATGTEDCVRRCWLHPQCSTVALTAASTICRLYNVAQESQGTFAPLPQTGNSTGSGARWHTLNASGARFAARPYVDYVPAVQSFTIPEGAHRTTFPIEIVGDTEPELRESFHVRLLNATSSYYPDQTVPGLLAVDTLTRTMELQIYPNDIPHGRFILQQPEQKYFIVEESGQLIIKVTNEPDSDRMCFLTGVCLMGAGKQNCVPFGSLGALVVVKHCPTASRDETVNDGTSSISTFSM